MKRTVSIRGVDALAGASRCVSPRHDARRAASREGPPQPNAEVAIAGGGSQVSIDCEFGLEPGAESRGDVALHNCPHDRRETASADQFGNKGL